MCLMRRSSHTSKLTLIPALISFAFPRIFSFTCLCALSCRNAITPRGAGSGPRCGGTASGCYAGSMCRDATSVSFSSFPFDALLLVALRENELFCWCLCVKPEMVLVVMQRAPSESGSPVPMLVASARCIRSGCSGPVQHCVTTTSAIIVRCRQGQSVF
jgi:hypothetical protein